MEYKRASVAECMVIVGGSMQDGDLVRVKTGKHAGLTGKLVGEPGSEGVAIKLHNTSIIVDIPYNNTPQNGTPEELLELVPPADGYHSYHQA